MSDFPQPFLLRDVKKLRKDKNAHINHKAIEYVILTGYTEITSVLDTIKLNEKFISIFPPKEDGINYGNYLSYHVHNYLQEVYILQQHFLTFKDILKNTYIKTNDKNKIVL